MTDGWWFGTDEENWYPGGETREQAIAEGRSNYPDTTFMIAFGGPSPLSQSLFHADELADFIDSSFEEAGWEDGLAAEISKDELNELTADINRVWWSWAQKIGLQARVRGLRLGPHEIIPSLSDNPEP